MFADYELGLGVLWEEEQGKGGTTTGQKLNQTERFLSCVLQIQDSDLCDLLAGARKVISGDKRYRDKGKSQELKALS